MAPRTPDKDPHTPTTAVIQVADDGTVTLYLGTEIVELAAGVDSTVVMRVLVDYAATIDTGLRVTTQMPDGTWTRHLLDPDGTVTLLARNLPAAPAAASPVGNAEASRSPHATVRTRIRTRAARGWLLAMLILLVAALVAVLATTY